MNQQRDIQRVTTIARARDGAIDASSVTPCEADVKQRHFQLLYIRNQFHQFLAKWSSDDPLSFQHDRILSQSISWCAAVGCLSVSTFLLIRSARLICSACLIRSACLIHSAGLVRTAISVLAVLLHRTALLSRHALLAQERTNILTADLQL